MHLALNGVQIWRIHFSQPMYVGGIQELSWCCNSAGCENIFIMLPSHRSCHLLLKKQRLFFPLLFEINVQLIHMATAFRALWHKLPKRQAFRSMSERVFFFFRFLLGHTVSFNQLFLCPLLVLTPSLNLRECVGKDMFSWHDGLVGLWAWKQRDSIGVNPWYVICRIESFIFTFYVTYR